ncbi:hypothetical protein JCM8097_008179 [Rhodosporidiobolus ruineniae]
MATTASPPAHPRTTTKGSHKRVFRSISRFLSGNSSKQRPKLNTQHGEDRAAAPPAQDSLNRASNDGDRTPSRSRSRSRASSTHRTSAEGQSREDGQLALPGDRDGHDGAPSFGRRRSGSQSQLSGFSGADTDASIYPISPSTRPPSSILAPTVDSAGASINSFPLTTGAGSTYAKSYASTKPTTLLSIDSGAGANRIATVPGTGARFGAGQQAQQQQVAPGAAGGGMSTSPSGGSLAAPVSSGGPGITFSSLPASASSSSTPPASSPPTAASHPLPPPNPHRFSTSSSSSSLLSAQTTGTNPRLSSYHPDSPSSPSHSLSQGGTAAADFLGYAPPYTSAHPRNNPHPAQPALDNASVLTLASSSFAPSFVGSGAASTTTAGGGGGGKAESWGGGGLGGLKAWSTKQARSLGGAGRGRGASSSTATAGEGKELAPSVLSADEDASVRALAGSRRPSEESLGARSTWSAVVLNNPSSALGAAGKERQGSILSRATGGEGGEDDDADEVGAGKDGALQRRRRSSLRTFATGDDLADSPVDAEDGERAGAGEVDPEEQAAAPAGVLREETRRAATDGGEGEEDDALLTPSLGASPILEAAKGEKGKGVDMEEHVGVKDGQEGAEMPPPVPMPEGEVTPTEEKEVEPK